jgi:glycosyltransferase involved in cell wall biosynthesis
VSFELTGAQRRIPSAIREQLPTNVRLLGYLSERDYIRRLEAADVVLCLTTEPLSVMRGACEAVYAERPLVTSDWPALRDFFPGAVHVKPTARAIAAGVQTALARHDELRAKAPELRRGQGSRWEHQLAALAEVLEIELAQCVKPHRPILTRSRHHLTVGGQQ